jgi:hypothetical protein
VLGEHSVVSHLTVDEFDAWLEPDLQHVELHLHRHALVLVNVVVAHLGE